MKDKLTEIYQKYGGKTYIRSAKDIAFQVPLLIARNGSYVNYYMYHGGTNFVEQALQCKSQLIMIKLILMNMLKWGQLKELHAAIKLCSTTLVQGA
ncbi:beta-galactosidase 16 [Quercus suber]|uniref:beta-galactosidase n=1 Tax=Quercus suber TaxID=58331 RepID=A0AAW0LJ10_QUESU